MRSFLLLYLRVVFTDATTSADAPHTVYCDPSVYCDKACVMAARSVWRTVQPPFIASFFRNVYGIAPPGLHTWPQTRAGWFGFVSGHNRCI